MSQIVETNLNAILKNIDYLENISKIQFSILNSNEINESAVCEVLRAETYDGILPVMNGLFDSRMGSCPSGKEKIVCPIDDNIGKMCPGYFGKIELGLPVFNHHYLPYIEKIIKIVCLHCSNILIDKNDPEIIKELGNKKGNSRFLIITKLAGKNKRCNHCNYLNPIKIIKQNSTTMKDKDNIVKFKAEYAPGTFTDPNADTEQILRPEFILSKFKSISKENIDFLGLSYRSTPADMLISTLAISPPSVRPSVRQPDNKRSEDDLTFALINIIKANNALRDLLSNNKTPQNKIDKQQGLLQFYCSTLMDNEIPGQQQAHRTSHRPLKSLKQRLSGKDGRFRWNLMGKRTDYSARTVLSGDPNLNIEEYGVPLKIAMILTYPEIVTRLNINTLKKTISNGIHNYPGARSVYKSGTGLTYNLLYANIEHIIDSLQIGDVVERHLIDGDICLFNRQPSLHRMSMMAHKIKVLPYDTFRINYSVCKSYNADNDGNADMTGFN